MKRLMPYLPAVLSATALAVFAAAFVCEYNSFGAAVIGWAKGDLNSRSQLAASTLGQALSTDDFRSIHEFGAMCSRDGFRLRISNKAGGLVFDTEPGDRTGLFWGTAEIGEYTVSVGIGKQSVLRPFHRATGGFVLSGLTGTAAVLLFFFMTYRQRVRIRELSRLEKFRRDFISDVSHEIKTPLTGIIGAVELLDEIDTMPKDVRSEALSMIRRESVRINDLVRDILTLSRLERGAGGGFGFAVSDVAEIVRESVSRFSVRAQKAGVVLGSDIVGPCFVNCDGTQIARAVDNLIANALSHSSSPDVLVSLRKIGTNAVIAVEDHGIGIAPDQRGKIFDRFHRVDPSRSESTGGSGLGLSIVRGIAALHDGNVRMEPVSPSGCRFTLTLPADIKATETSALMV